MIPTVDSTSHIYISYCRHIMYVAVDGVYNWSRWQKNVKFSEHSKALYLLSSVSTWALKIVECQTNLVKQISEHTVGWFPISPPLTSTKCWLVALNTTIVQWMPNIQSYEFYDNMSCDNNHTTCTYSTLKLVETAIKILNATCTISGILSTES